MLFSKRSGENICDIAILSMFHVSYLTGSVFQKMGRLAQHKPYGIVYLVKKPILSGIYLHKRVRDSREHREGNLKTWNSKPRIVFYTHGAKTSNQ